MNIGKWIVVAFVLFTGFIATLVTVCMREDISLVSKNYYKEELEYQDQIQRVSNTNALQEKPAIKIIDGNKIQLAFSDLGKIQKGQLRLFCPSNEKKDRIYDINPNGAPTQLFEFDKLQRGMYRAKLTWTMSGKEYYHEEILYF